MADAAEEIIKVIGGLIAGIVAIIVIIGIAILVLSVGAFYGFGISVANYVRALKDNVKPERPQE
jgi:hypothetical protein